MNAPCTVCIYTMCMCAVHHDFTGQQFVPVVQACICMFVPALTLTRAQGGLQHERWSDSFVSCSGLKPLRKHLAANIGRSIRTSSSWAVKHCSNAQMFEKTSFLPGWYLETCLLSKMQGIITDACDAAFIKKCEFFNLNTLKFGPLGPPFPRHLIWKRFGKLLQRWCVSSAFVL